MFASVVQPDQALCAEELPRHGLLHASCTTLSLAVVGVNCAAWILVSPLNNLVVLHPSIDLLHESAFLEFLRVDDIVRFWFEAFFRLQVDSVRKVLETAWLLHLR